MIHSEASQALTNRSEGHCELSISLKSPLKRSSARETTASLPIAYWSYFLTSEVHRTSLSRIPLPRFTDLHSSVHDHRSPPGITPGSGQLWTPLLNASLFSTVRLFSFHSCHYVRKSTIISLNHRLSGHLNRCLPASTFIVPRLCRFPLLFRQRDGHFRWVLSDFLHKGATLFDEVCIFSAISTIFVYFSILLLKFNLHCMNFDLFPKFKINVMNFDFIVKIQNQFHEFHFSARHSSFLSSSRPISRVRESWVGFHRRAVSHVMPLWKRR